MAGPSEDQTALNLWLLEPYYGGSHKAWADGFCRWSRHAIQTITLPPRFWKWRMHGAALQAARRLESASEAPDLIIASDMLDLASFLGLTREKTAGVPIVLYMHENQWTYPQQAIDPDWSESRRRRAERRDMHYPFINLTSMLAADEIWWNSRHNLESALQAIPDFMRSFPDAHETIDIAALRRKSKIVAPGVDLAMAGATDSKLEQLESRPARILWNHRWEFDKRPEVFFAAVDSMVDRGLDFELVLLGERFGELPAGAEEGLEKHSDRIRISGHLESRDAYWDALRSSDIIVSTAIHEFFGISIVEGVAAGCWPIVPNSLSYPEVLPKAAHTHCLYEDFETLCERLAFAIASVSGDKGAGPSEIQERSERKESLQRAMGAYDWQSCISTYDDGIRDLYVRRKDNG